VLRQGPQQSDDVLFSGLVLRVQGQLTALKLCEEIGDSSLHVDFFFLSQPVPVVAKRRRINDLKPAPLSDQRAGPEWIRDLVESPDYRLQISVYAMQSGESPAVTVQGIERQLPEISNAVAMILFASHVGARNQSPWLGSLRGRVCLSSHSCTSLAYEFMERFP
jgi:hypothetical protein